MLRMKCRGVDEDEANDGSNVQTPPDAVFHADAAAGANARQRSEAEQRRADARLMHISKKRGERLFAG